MWKCCFFLFEDVYSSTIIIECMILNHDSWFCCIVKSCTSKIKFCVWFLKFLCTFFGIFKSRIFFEEVDLTKFYSNLWWGGQGKIPKCFRIKKLIYRKFPNVESFVIFFFKMLRVLASYSRKGHHIPSFFLDRMYNIFFYNFSLDYLLTLL